MDYVLISLFSNRSVINNNSALVTRSSHDGSVELAISTWIVPGLLFESIGVTDGSVIGCLRHVTQNGGHHNEGIAASVVKEQQGSLSPLCRISYRQTMAALWSSHRQSLSDPQACFWALTQDVGLRHKT